MDIKVIEKLDLKARCGMLLIPVIQGRVLDDPVVRKVDKRLGGEVAGMAEQENFRGKSGQSLCFGTLGKAGPRRVCLLGLGEAGKLSEESYRRAAGSAAEALRRANARDAVVVSRVPGESDITIGELTGALVEGLVLGTYRFDKYKSRKDDEPRYEGPESVGVFCCDARGAARRQAAEALEAVIERSRLIAAGTLEARELVNEIPQEMTPLALADKARQLVKGIDGLKVRVMDRDQMAAEKMEAALAVARGSENPPCFIEITYEPAGVPQDDPLLVLVGKGVTFDSGGLNIKPGDHMSTMKTDMSGAAAVVNAIAVIARMKLPLRCAALVAAVENMPSGRSYKPDDVIRAMNGTTIEVGNTDAEGRLTLADALGWATHKLGAARIIDLATLTGSCVVALGPTTAGLFGNDEEWASLVRRAAEDAGEKVCRLPLDDDMNDDIKSDFADVKNIGSSRYGGAITAALFLKRFVRDTPWVHLDIAGPAWADKRRHYEPSGGTGFGVRTLVRVAEEMSARKK